MTSGQTPHGTSTDEPAEGAPDGLTEEPETIAPHPDEPAEGDRADSAHDAP